MTRCRVSAGKRAASGTSFRISETVVRDRLRLSANFLNVIREPDSTLKARLGAADFFGFARIPKPAYHVFFHRRFLIIDKGPKSGVESTLVSKLVNVQ
jgi:hypothetical protein